MKSFVILSAALLAAAEALPEMANGWTLLGKRAPNGKQIPKQPARLDSETSQGCFKSSGNLTFITTPDFNSLGGCAKNICGAKGYAVAATTLANQCWCGSWYPRKSDLVDDDFCDLDCLGYDVETCGGDGYWSVYHTGKTMAVKFLPEEKKETTTSASSTPTPTPTESKTDSETETTGTQTPTSEPESSGGTNVAGIVAGVVVGVVVLAALIGGGFLYMRRKRNKEIEEEHRRNAAVNAFIGKPPGSSGAGSMTDSRLDPVMAHRRMSDGSIADNQDYSRRILRVTNA